MANTNLTMAGPERDDSGTFDRNENADPQKADRIERRLTAFLNLL